MIATIVRPSIQPSVKAGPLERALAEKSIRMTAMIGIGLIATPTAAGRMSAIALPIARISLVPLCRPGGLR